MPRATQVDPGARAIRAVLVGALLALAVLACLMGPVATRPAHAEDAPTTATVVLEAATTSTLRPAGTLVLAGTVTNTGTDLLRTVQVITRTSTEPLETRDQIAVVGEDEEFRAGRRDTRHFEALARVLDPGASAAFSLEVPVADLGFRAQGVYVVGVDVTATLPDRSRATVAQDRTVVPYVVDAALPSVPVAVLWSLTDAPALLPDGSLADDRLAAALAPGGRLGRLVAAGTSAPVSWLVDPDLVGTVLDMADGYAVRRPDGSTALGTGEAAAAGWLISLGQSLASRPFVGALPAADTDLVATVRSGAPQAGAAVTQAVAPERTLAATLAELPEESGGRGAVVASGLVGPVGGALDDATAEVVAAAGGRGLVLRADALEPAPSGPRATLGSSPGSATGTPVAAGAVPLEVVATDPVLDAALALASGADAQVQVRQRILAATAMSAMTAVDDGTTPAPLVAQAPHGWAPTAGGLEGSLDAWTGTPWVQAVGLEAALAAAPPAAPVRLDYDEADRSVELSDEQLGAVAGAKQHLDRFATVLVDPRRTVDTYDTALLRGLSAAWRQDGAGGRAYVAAVVDDADRSLAAVQVGVPEELTLSGRTGRFPVSITNGLDQAVQVGLAFSSANPDRLTVVDVPPQVVEAGETAQVLVEAEARANGRVGVGVRAVAPDGVAIAPMQSFVVVATNFDTIGWVVVGGAVTVLVLASGIRLARRARRARERRRAGHSARPSVAGGAAAPGTATGGRTGRAGRGERQPSSPREHTGVR